MFSLKRGKKPKKSSRIRKARRGYSPSPPTSPRIVLPVESRSPSPVALRNRKRRSGSESPHPEEYKRPTLGAYADDPDYSGFPSHRVVPSNYLRFKKEVNHRQFSNIAVDISGYDVVNLPNYENIVHPSVVQLFAGSGQTFRDGNDIRVLRIGWKFEIETLYEIFTPVLIPPPIGMFDFERTHHVRLCIIRDKFCRGVEPRLIPNGEIWNVPPSSRVDLAFREIANLNRFEILYDETISVEWNPPVTYVDGVSPGATAGVGWFPRWRSAPYEVWIDKQFDVRYTGPGGNITDIDQNNVFIVAYPGAFGLLPARRQTAFITRSEVRMSFVNK